MENFLFWFNIATAIALVIFILAQNKATGLSATFGGGGAGYSSTRGVDRVLFWLTIVTAVLFFGGALAYLFV